MIDEFIDKLTAFRETIEGRLLCEDARFSGENVLPGFECRVAELFAEVDFTLHHRHQGTERQNEVLL